MTIQNNVGGLYNPITNMLLNSGVTNDATTLRRYFSRSVDAGVDSRRDLNDECGFPNEIQTQDYVRMYERSPIASRVVEVWPDECWSVSPIVYESENEDEETVFEKSWKQLSNVLSKRSYYVSEADHAIWEYLHRVDVLSGIGQFGILLIGVNDGADLLEPLQKRNGLELAYLRAYSEGSVSITRSENDKTNPRYGMPLEYQITNKNGVTMLVHYSRIIHVADNLSGNEVFGRPRMRSSFNNLLSLNKMYGGSAEMYWRGAFPGVSLETHPQLGGDVNVDVPALRDAMENYMNGLQRYFVTSGMTAKTHAPNITDPASWIDKQIEAICIQQKIPKRIFMGSERGELASSQDDDNWTRRLQFRQNNYLTNRLVVPFVNRCIEYGILPEPREGFRVYWQDFSQLTEEQKAAIAVKRSEAIAKYVQSGSEALVPPWEFLTKILGMDGKEAEAIIEGAMQSLTLEPYKDDEEEKDAE